MLFLVLDQINTSIGWAMMQPRQHAVDLVVRPLQQGLHRTVVQIAHPAFYTLQVRMAHGGRPKTHALNMPAYRDEQGFKAMLVMQRFDRLSPEP